MNGDVISEHFFQEKKNEATANFVNPLKNFENFVNSAGYFFTVSLLVSPIRNSEKLPPQPIAERSPNQVPTELFSFGDRQKHGLLRWYNDK